MCRAQQVSCDGGAASAGRAELGGKGAEAGGGRGSTTVEDALTATGFGRYNYLLLALCSWMLQAMGMDLFGASLTVTAAACDLNLTMYQQGLLSAVPFIGVIAGAHAWGYLSDTRGRKATLAWSMSGGFVFAALSSLAPDWRVMAVLKFCSSCFTSATNSAAYTLLGESCPASVRSRSLLLMSCALMMSQGVSAAIAYPVLPMQFALRVEWLGVTLRPWRLLVLLLAAPCGVTALLLRCFHESPKFLASRGRHDDALRVLQRIYASNTGDLPENYQVSKLSVEEGEQETSASPLRALWQQTAPLFRPPLLKRTLHLFYLVLVVYTTGSGFIMWLPYLMNKLFAVLAASGGAGAGMNMCAVLDYAGGASLAANSTESVMESCDDTIQPTTLLSAITYGALASGANLLLSLVSGQRKRRATLLVLGASCASALLVNLVPVALAGVFFFFFFLMIALSMGILSVYFVELYPTQLRGMASCLAVLVGRSSAFVGINVIGHLLVTSCEATFYGWSLLVLSAFVCAWYLPSDPPSSSTALESELESEK